jgi:translation initiation factor RLI1
MKVGDKHHVAIWDAINDLVVASGGGHTNYTNVFRQKAVCGVEAALSAAMEAENARMRTAISAALRISDPVPFQDATQSMRVRLKPLATYDPPNDRAN